MENSRSPIGTVHLVGAGPGDPDLLTLRAARLIGSAKVIVHDGLVDPSILALAHPAAQLISVAKQRARHTMAQDEINALLVRTALAGDDVVRLKGGDPFIFGGGAAQIPLTHRASASIVSFVAGQCKGLTEQDWSGLAGKGRTLVIYMGVATSEAIAEKLMADGLAPDVPVAVIENATRADMRVLRGPLAGLPSLVAREKVKSPALIVIGEVTGQSEEQLRQFAAEVER